MGSAPKQHLKYALHHGILDFRLESRRMRRRSSSPNHLIKIKVISALANAVTGSQAKKFRQCRGWRRSDFLGSGSQKRASPICRPAFWGSHGPSMSCRLQVAYGAYRRKWRVWMMVSMPRDGYILICQAGKRFPFRHRNGGKITLEGFANGYGWPRTGFPDQ